MTEQKTQGGMQPARAEKSAWKSLSNSSVFILF